MYNIEKQTETVGAYIAYKEYFIFPFGFGDQLNSNELGIARFGGHREKSETVEECLKREIKEETNLSCNLTANENSFHIDEKTGLYQKIDIKTNTLTKPIFINPRKNNKISLMYLAQTEQEPKPCMETQGILFLRKSDINT